MKNSVEQLVEPSEVALELEMQELEAMEAPKPSTHPTADTVPPPR